MAVEGVDMVGISPTAVLLVDGRLWGGGARETQSAAGSSKRRRRVKGGRVNVKSRLARTAFLSLPNHLDALKGAVSGRGGNGCVHTLWMGRAGKVTTRRSEQQAGGFALG